MIEFVELAAAKQATGVRIVVAGVLPSPWSEAVKGLLRVAKLPAVAVRAVPGDREASAWTGVDNVPVVLYADEPARTCATAIVGLIARLAPDAAIVPAEPAARVETMGLIELIAGEDGLGWNERLAMIQPDANGFPEPVARRLGKRYGYRADDFARVRARLIAQLETLVAKLGARDCFGGDRPNAVDIYAATFLTPLFPLADADCPRFLPIAKQGFAAAAAALGGLVPAQLAALRARMFERHLVARVEIAAPPERVWNAITREVASWWGSDAMYKTTKHEIDLRPGGAWRSEGVGADGSAFHVGGTVVELDPPRKYVMTWQPSWSPAPPSTVTYVLEPIASGTRLTLSHTGFTDPASCESHGDGWTHVLEWLVAYAEPKPRYYLCRLMPPRPSFMADMTADERAVMQAHGVYWRGKLAEGKVVAFGPVMEGYGIGFVAASDEAALREFEQNDPAIKSQRGFRYEHSPMAALVF